MISLGLQSLTCFDISLNLKEGLAVVAIAPRETIARKETGKRIEFGAKMRTTSFLEIWNWRCNAEARVET